MATRGKSKVEAGWNESVEYSDDIAATICQRIADGDSVHKICREVGFPNRRTIFKWLIDHPDFVKAYSAAREMQADKLADEIIELADGSGDFRKVRNQIEARKWKSSRMAPRKYGDRVALEHSGDGGGPVIVEMVRFGAPPPDGRTDGSHE